VKTVVVFGSGHVARPAIVTLLRSGHKVVVATDQPRAGERLLVGHPRGRVLATDANDPEAVAAAVRQGELCVSLLPVEFHVRVAQACVAEGRPLVTTSYVSDAMRALDEGARAAGVLLLNEVGADPGIDHMQAMRLIHRIEREAGSVRAVTSVCGGIPAPEANDNPFGYKLSWSTRGVVLAGRRRARYRRDEEIVEVGPLQAFDHSHGIAVDGLGKLETYPNGDALRFETEYGLEGLQTMFRGSLRWPGWCETWASLARLGFVDDAPEKELAGSTYEDVSRRAGGARPGERARPACARLLGLPAGHPVLGRLDWLGLFSEREVPEEARSRADLLVALMEERLQYRAGERDMVILLHEIRFVDAAGRERSVRSSTREFGRRNGDSAMARMVGLPAAFAAVRILDGTIRERGSGSRSCRRFTSRSCGIWRKLASVSGSSRARARSRCRRLREGVRMQPPDRDLDEPTTQAPARD
jgi:saccharopine dehydrogenase-like NADP-dependent oxidoreductase